VRPFRRVRPATYKPLFELLEDRLAPAATVWTGADFAHNLNWSNPANWSNGVPQAGDTAEFTNNSSVRDFTSNVDAGFNAASTVGALTIDALWGGTINVNGPLTVSGNFSLASGSFGGNGAVVVGGNSSQWTGGTLSVGTSGFTNNGTLNLSTSAIAGLVLSGPGTLANAGTINQSLSGPSLHMENAATLSNQGTYVFASRQDVLPMGSVGPNTFLNSGTLESTGPSISFIETAFSNSGHITVTGGELSIASQGGTNTGGVFSVSSGATLELSGLFGGTVVYGGIYTGSGGGTLQMDRATLAVAPGGATFNFPGSMFQWTGGTIDVSNGDFTNAGNIALNLGGFGPATLTGPGRLINTGTITESNANLVLDNGSTLYNSTKGTYRLQVDHSLLAGTHGGTDTFFNAGLLSKSTGTGTSTLSVALNNTGRLEVRSGTLNASGTVTQATGSTLTAGSWSVFGTSTVHSTLTLSSAGSFTIIGSLAHVTLSGPNSTFTNIAPLATVQGSFSLLNAQSFTTAGGFTNSGQLTLGPGSTLTVNGNLVQSSTGTLTVQMGGTGTPLIGSITTAPTGTVSLNGHFHLTISHVIPAVGSTFDIFDDGSPSAITGIFIGLPEGSSIIVSGMTFQISYVGGDGNDVTLTRIS
jgi:hypothetical protein